MKKRDEEEEQQRERELSSLQPAFARLCLSSCSKIHATTLSASLPISSRDHGSSSAPQKWSNPGEISSEMGWKSSSVPPSLFARALLTLPTEFRAARSLQKRSQSPIFTKTGRLGTAERAEKHFPDPRAIDAAVPSGGETATKPPTSTTKEVMVSLSFLAAIFFFFFLFFFSFSFSFTRRNHEARGGSGPDASAPGVSHDESARNARVSLPSSAAAKREGGRLSRRRRRSCGGGAVAATPRAPAVPLFFPLFLVVSEGRLPVELDPFARRNRPDHGRGVVAALAAPPQRRQQQAAPAEASADAAGVVSGDCSEARVPPGLRVDCGADWVGQGAAQGRVRV